MSQHQIELNSPIKGHVQATVGYDGRLDEAFFSYHNRQAQFSTAGGIAIDDIQDVAMAQLGVRIPQPVIDAVHADLADLRLGATDINRRLFQYTPEGALVQSHRW
jgi:hypothetical protein